ncbi:MAG: DUF4395 domain-containing protein [Actinomycetota bacterium]|nr:DUF4395 domain-containing protein [Actinomycetota bacterium]
MTTAKTKKAAEATVGGKQGFFSFPDPVNEVAARAVAIGVVLQVVLLAMTHNRLLFIPLCYGFLARVSSGPKISPMGIIATKLVAPRLSRYEKLVAGKPKRFAQAIGVIFSFGAAILSVAFSSFTPALVVLIALGLAASLEGFLGFCLGCKIFGIAFNLGLVNYDDCPTCVVNYTALSARKGLRESVN